MKKLTHLLLVLLVALIIACNSQPRESSPVTADAPQLKQAEKASPITAAPPQPQLAETQTPALQEPTSKRRKSNPLHGEPVPATIRTSTSLTSAPDPTGSTTAEPTTLTIADIYKHFEKAPQTFTLPLYSDTTIICREGTSLYFPSNAFVSEKTGKEVNGPVQVSVKEYYQLADIILSNLSTSSDSEILETGGMLHLTASAGNERCVLKRNHKIEIGFPYEKPKPGMQLFSGVWTENTVDWKLADQKNSRELLMNNRAGNRFRGRKRTQKPDRNLSYMGGDRSMQRHLDKYAQYPISALKKRTEGTVVVVVKIDGVGEIAEVKVKKRVSRELDKAAVYAVKNMKKWRPARVDNHNISAIRTIPVTFSMPETEIDAKMLMEARRHTWRIRKTRLSYGDIKSESKISTNNKQYKEEFEKRFASTNPDELSSGELQQYLFRTSELGWINCDRFYQTDQPKIDYVIRPDRPENLAVKVIFHSARSILPGSPNPGHYRVSKVPVGEKITIVAFKTEQNKVLLAVKETTIQKSGEKDLIFEPVTMAKLKEEMEKLNRLN